MNIGNWVFYQATDEITLPALVTSVEKDSVALIAFDASTKVFGSQQIMKGFKIVKYSKDSEIGTYRNIL